VLIVDRSTESREVLRTLLERRGALTIEAKQPQEALSVARWARLDLIVLDVDSDALADRRAAAELAASARRNDTPILILGTISPHSRGIPGGEIIAKPYHYGPLIRKIEELLAAA
jgi:CheY-like chemotaxis protein